MRTLEVVKKVVKKAKVAARETVAAVRKAVARQPRALVDPWDNETARRELVNAEAERTRAARARVLDELLSGDEGAGFLGPRRRGWLR